MKIGLEEKILNCYNYCYKIFGKKSSIKKLGEREQKLLSNFFQNLKKQNLLDSIGDNWVFDFITYGFFTRHDYQVKNSYDNLSLQNIIGPKAIEKYSERTEEQYFVFQEFLSKNKIFQQDIFKECSKKNSFFSNNEIERRRFFNQEKGFINCITYTDLYDIRSSFCLGCDYKDECKKVKESQNEL